MRALLWIHMRKHQHPSARKARGSQSQGPGNEHAEEKKTKKKKGKEKKEERKAVKSVFDAPPPPLCEDNLQIQVLRADRGLFRR